MIDWASTVHGIGDLHAGEIAPERAAALLDDVLSLPTPTLHLQIGDATEHGRAAEDELALGWLARLPGPCTTILGNHDILDNGRTPGQWARAYGRRSKNFAVDLGFARILAVGPDRSFPGESAGLLAPATLTWLERQLARSQQDCWIACHWPLAGTVLGDPERLFTSAMPSFHVKPDRELRALLARHRNAKAWLAGHTHSPLTAPGLVARARLARRRTILAVNLSSILGIGKRPTASDPVRSVYLTHRSDAVEVRFRDHRSGAWMAVGGKRVIRARV